MSKKKQKREPTDEEIESAAQQHAESIAEVQRENKKIRDKVEELIDGGSNEPDLGDLEWSIKTLSQKEAVESGMYSFGKNIYLAGYHYGHDSMWNLFKENGTWEHGRETPNTKIVKVQVGSLIILKTTATKGNILYLDGLGIVTENPRDGFKLVVNWIVPKDKFKRVSLEGLSAAFPDTFKKVASRYFEKILGAIGNDYLRSFTDKKDQKLSGLTIVSENEDVFLKAEVIAKEFANVIDRSRDISLSGKNRTSQEDRFYGIFGQWGRGKTKFWNLVSDSLLEKGNYRIIDFHAWKYQETPAVWAYLYEKFADEFYYKSKFYPVKFMVNLFQSLYLSWFRNPGTLTLFFVAYFGLLLIEADFLSAIFAGKLKIISSALAGFTMIATLIRSVSKPFVSNASTLMNLIRRRDFKTHLGIQHETQEELAILLKAWFWKIDKNESIVLFIDDIDRCDEKKIIQIVDSIRVMLNEPEIQKRLIVVAAIDERILCQAIRKKYESFLDVRSKGLNIERLTAEYLDKLFIAGIKLNELTGTEIQTIFDGYANGITIKEPIEIGENDSGSNTNTNIENDDEENAQELYQNSEVTISSENQVNTSYELSFDEKEMLKALVMSLKDATPRSIRGFLIRYRLARSLVDIIQSSSNSTEKMKRNHIIAEAIINSMNFEPFEYSKNTNLMKASDVLISIVSMVDYYHHPNTSAYTDAENKETK
ncbi:MAG: hypothetical protein JXR07_11935 [Reichenbachiella sp.]